MKNVFVIAMESEADAVLRHLSDVLRFEECGRIVYQGLLNGEQTAVVICGIGKVNAAAGTQYAIDHFSPERIVNLGVAGGLDASMSVGQVYSISKCFQCDFDLSLINHTPKGTVNEYDSPFFELEAYIQNSCPISELSPNSCSALAQLPPNLPTAIVSTGDSFVNGDPDRDFVYGEMGAWLRDMELAAIAHVCKRAGVRCCALKSVSDVHFPDRPPPTEQYAVNLKKAVDALSSFVLVFCADFMIK